MPRKEEQNSSQSNLANGVDDAKATLLESENASGPANVSTSLDSQTGFPNPFLVGIGSSAGGLKAMQEFFQNMPVDCGVSFVVITHLGENRKSLLPEIIQRVTSMPTKQIKHNALIEPNSVYLNPPGFNVEVSGRHFSLKRIGKVGSVNSPVNLPIDSFFFSMAAQYGARSIGIILSGSGSDGASGCRAIEEAGGLVMVQDPQEAAHSGMPKSALSQANQVVSLPVEKMPNEILRQVAMSPGENHRLSVDELEIATHPQLPKLFKLLLTRTGHDFSEYKSNTISRRIRRRMAATQSEGLTEYVEFVDHNQIESHRLLNDILIGVTSFFRDAKAFATLQSEVLPSLIEKKKSGSVFRIWVVGCSTGEEVYSLAILVHEYISSQDCMLEIQIFATDIDDEAIDIARTGSYPQSIRKRVSPSRLKQYFDEDDDGTFRVRRVIRELVVFAQQNVTSDPPFTKLDLLCCRNLLIYFSRVLQARLFPLFHYTLNPGGILFLGSSESAANHGKLLTPVSKKWKIYQKRLTGHHRYVNFPTNVKPLENKQEVMTSSNDQPDPLQFVEAILEEGSAPTCVVINTDFDILYVHGRTGKFLEPAPGKISTNLVAMARTGLKAELSSMIRKAFTSGNNVTRNDIVFNFQGENAIVSITAKLIKSIAGTSPELMVIVFQDPTKEESSLKLEKLNRLSNDKSHAELQLELKESNENMQAAIEELQSANEELKSTNEELQSTNEELQSTNEELETSKEELQSVNEESATVNQELETRNQELSDSSDVLKNLLDSTEVACLFLDGEFKIRTFTPRAVDLIPLEKTDHGRLISNFSTHIVDEVDLCRFANDILDRLESKEVRISTHSGESYVLKGRPYRTLANVIDGVVLTFEKGFNASER